MESSLGDPITWTRAELAIEGQEQVTEAVAGDL